MDLMAPLARLKDRQKQEVLDFLLSHSRNAAIDASLDEDQLFFEEKCSRCHTIDRILLSPIQGETLRHVVNRMQSRSGTDWLSNTEVERVLAYLDDSPRKVAPASRLDGDTTPDEVFAVRCATCHTLERVFRILGEPRNTAEFWSHTVSRMRSKSPQWMSESEADQILEYLQSVDPLVQ